MPNAEKNFGEKFGETVRNIGLVAALSGGIIWLLERHFPLGIPAKGIIFDGALLAAGGEAERRLAKSGK